MKKWERKLPGFIEIYGNSKKENMINYLNEIENKLMKLINNKKIDLDLMAHSVHKLIYVIEKIDLSNSELEKMAYSLAYFFLKDYIKIKELIELSKISELELKKESVKSVELLKKYYILIENQELNTNQIFDTMKRFVEWINLQK